MNIIQPTVEVWRQEPGVEGLYRHIERCARICYRSENNGKMTSEEFVKMLIKKDHGRALEFGTIVLENNDAHILFPFFDHWEIIYNHPFIFTLDGTVIITNLRFLVESCNEWEKILNERCIWDDFFDVNEWRPTVHWHISRGIADEFRTHTMLSSLMESTRYVNYDKSGMDFVRPTWYNDKGDTYDCTRARRFIDMCATLELAYKECLDNGHKPETAREVLPLCIATNLVQCGFNRDWDNFFYRRCDSAAHPDSIYISKIAKKLLYHGE